MAQQVFEEDTTKATARRQNIQPSGHTEQRSPTFLGGRIDPVTGNLIKGTVQQTSQGHTVTPLTPVTPLKDVVSPPPTPAAPTPEPEPEPELVYFPGRIGGMGKGGGAISWQNYAANLRAQGLGRGATPQQYHADQMKRFYQQTPEQQRMALQRQGSQPGVSMARLLQEV
ncbi:hypothetical protein QMT40_001780 [Parvibaculaceae bacterium PLY_AMNH_Bact1]|nr:hypothetical protein QMT40_001780 [Parvibaculaceae bacterium PLY_AMNH_Bact1]